MTQEFGMKIKTSEVVYHADNGQIKASLNHVLTPSGEVSPKTVNLNIFCPFWDCDQGLKELPPKQARLLAEAILELLEED